MEEQSFLDKITNVELPGILHEYVIHNAFDKLLEFTSKQINLYKKEKIGNKEEDNEIIFKTTQHDIYFGLTQNLKKSLNWASSISFKDMQHSKLTASVFIHIDFYLTPKKTHFTSNEKRLPFNKILKIEKYHTVILGGPGAGKSTLLKHVLLQELRKNVESRYFLSIIFIRLRDIQINKDDILYKSIILKQLAEELRLNFHFPFPEKTITITDENGNIRKEIAPEYIQSRQNYNKFLEDIVLNFLDTYKFLILIDGLDEVQNQEAKSIITSEISKYCLQLNASKIILTSRTGDFNIHFANSATFEIAPLSDDQIQKFIKKWFRDKSQSETLFTKIRKSPFFDTALRPLNLAHLCAIFERNGDIPDKPKSIYRKILYLLMDEWNEQWHVKRDSKFQGFTTERKLDFISKIAFLITTQLGRASFSKEELRIFYTSICGSFDLPENENNVVVDEIESHTGLIVQSSDKIEFSHKSIQEYLTAQYVINLGSIPKQVKLLSKIPEELAVATAISHEPDKYLYSLMQILEVNFFSASFLPQFLSRLVIEKPDFTGHPYLAICFIKIYMECLVKHKRNDIEAILFSLSYLDQIDSMHKTFSSLPKYYPDTAISKSTLINGVLTFNISNTRKGIEEYEFEDIELPNVVHVNQVVMDRVYKNNKKRLIIIKDAI